MPPADQSRPFSCIVPKTNSFNLNPTDSGTAVYGRSYIPYLVRRIFEPLWPMPQDPLMLTFRDDSLNAAVSYLQKYLALNDSTEWFHVMILHVAFPSFMRAMDEDKGRTRTLPFFCWCDGGYSQERARRHCHMIVVSPKNHFTNNVWNKINIPLENQPHKNMLFLGKSLIQSPMQLVNILGSLTQREAPCQLTFHTASAYHFFVFKSLPVDYRLVLAVQWDGGILELARQEFGNMSSAELIQLVAKSDPYYGDQLKIKMKDLPNLRTDVQLPVSERFWPSPKPTDYFVHLTNQKKLYFTTVQNGTEKKYPLFYNVVGEETWIPGNSQIKFYNELKPILLKYNQLAKQRAQLKRDTRDMLCKALNVMFLNHRKLKEENVRLKDMCEALKNRKRSCIETAKPSRDARRKRVCESSKNPEKKKKLKNSNN